jgi:hypothetical protein
MEGLILTAMNGMYFLIRHSLVPLAFFLVHNGLPLSRRLYLSFNNIRNYIRLSPLFSTAVDIS